LVLMPICVLKVGSGCRVEFVELKNTTLGSKRMSPICLIWEDDIGAGTITANYDGVRNIPPR